MSLRRQYSGVARQYYPGLDRLRAWAITFVFLFHYVILSGGQPAWLADWASFGWSGVDLFFVLSGFLISSQLFIYIRDSGFFSIRTFVIRRGFRILPAYLVVLALYFLFPIFREKEALSPLWKFLTFTQNFGLNLVRCGTFSHCWSLCVEEHFYFLFPLSLLMLLKAGKWKLALPLLLSLLSMTILIRYAVYQYLYLPESGSDTAAIFWYQHIYYPTYTRLDGLFWGVLLAAGLIFRPVSIGRLLKYPGLLLLAGLGMLTVAWFICIDSFGFAASVFGFGLVAVGYALITAASIAPQTWFSTNIGWLPRHLARYSFAIYLTHKSVIHLVRLGLEAYEMSEEFMLLVCCVSCWLAGAFLYYLVERPFQKISRHILQQGVH